MCALKETKHSFGGIKVSNQDQMTHNFLCAFCELLLYKPTQLLCCGTRLCQWCSKNGISNSMPFTCPFCHTQQPKKDALDDRGVERELNMITVVCYLCSWTGSYKEYLKHLEEQHADDECSDCHKRFFTINSFEEHRQEICEYRLVSCGLIGCVDQVKLADMQAHFLSLTHQKNIIAFVKYISSVHHEPTNTEERVNTLSSQLKVLINYCKQLRSEHGHLESDLEKLILEIEERKTKFNEYNEILPEYTQTLNELVKEIKKIKQAISSTKIKFLDDNNNTIFRFEKNKLKINLPFSMSSEKFKTAPHGYLFQLRVCSTFDAIDGNQGYLSIYITLFRSDFDPILRFPFPYNISLSLLDQSEQKKDITSTITADPNSPSLARPITEKNNEFGLVKFCPLSCLTEAQSIFLKNGAFFIGVRFHFH